MGIAHVLEDFGSSELTSQSTIEISEVGFEEKRLEAFEQGYKAGWDDAIKAQADDQTRVASDFALNLQDLSFTYQEALGSLTKAMSPLFALIVNKVLPQMAQATLGVHVVEQLTEMARSEAEQPIEIVVSPENAPSIRILAERDLAMPIVITEEDSLGDGQVFLRFGATEREVNLDQVLNGISDAVDAFFYQAEPELKHG